MREPTVQERDGLIRLIMGKTAPSAANAILAAGYRKQPTIDAKLAAARDEIARLHERLEDNHVYRYDEETGEMVREDVKPGSIPDGIDCRDATIKLLDEKLERAKPTIDDAMVERAARALCQEKNAFLGEPHCSKTGPWPNDECCEPGCFVEARAALRAALEDAESKQKEMLR